ncbi:MAG TPA: hydrogenase formation protein HypD [Vicinamibacterales bacterium]|nr:hydrogenase formation protein HypD [Vicinamibacterales bacterium]
MKYVDEFRHPDVIRAAAAGVQRLAAGDRHFRIMEVCGGHTHAFYRFGLGDLLPANVELIHGPGCPVCVLPMGRVDAGLSLAIEHGVVLAVFGDVMRVPGRGGSPLQHVARGVDIRVVYSPLDALAIARREPDKHVVFFAIGFETTAPSTALTIARARALGVTNFSVLSNHVTIVPAIKAVLDSPDMRIDGFIGPGHVSTVIGCEPYGFICRHYRKPIVVSGFEPGDLLQSIAMLLRQLRDGRAEVENQYARAVPPRGNVAALRALAEVFEVRSFFEWRGLGFISQSALKIRRPYQEFDAEHRFALPAIDVADPVAAQCGEVLKGAIKPPQCKLFGRDCTPERPIGALMVSSEGACAAYYTHAIRSAMTGTSGERQ